MVLKKPLMVAGAVATIGLAGSAMAANIAAAETSGTAAAGSGSLADKIATKFNLNKDEVRAVFDEEHQAREAERRTKIEEKLTTAVYEGKLTEDQKKMILAKMDELDARRQANREDFQNMTEEERRTSMKQKHTELQQWADDNSIPEEYLRFGGPGRGHGPRPF
jgi:hypothetical protein